MTSPHDLILAFGLVAQLAFAPANDVKPPAAVITPTTGSQALRQFITQCEQQGGVAVVTVNKRDLIAMGCMRPAWERVEMPD